MEQTALDSILDSAPTWLGIYLLGAFIHGMWLLFKGGPTIPDERDVDSPIEVILMMLFGLLWPFALIQRIGNLFPSAEPAVVPAKPKRKRRPKPHRKKR
jgi:hypothetical protein